MIKLGTRLTYFENLFVVGSLISLQNLYKGIVVVIVEFNFISNKAEQLSGSIWRTYRLIGHCGYIVLIDQTNSQKELRERR